MCIFICPLSSHSDRDVTLSITKLWVWQWEWACHQKRKMKQHLQYDNNSSGTYTIENECWQRKLRTTEHLPFPADILMTGFSVLALRPSPPDTGSASCDVHSDPAHFVHCCDSASGYRKTRVATGTPSHCDACIPVLLPAHNICVLLLELRWDFFFENINQTAFT